MDVRCPNCQTEYELDESRLKPAGVTVKCASCEHVFRVRKRGSTASGVAAPKDVPPPPPPPRPPAPAPVPVQSANVVAPAPQAPAKPQRAQSSDGDEERSWLIRLGDGEIKVCREFATLQRWIVSGTVTDDCEISRSGKTWKPLSDLKELASFFAIAAEARGASTSASTSAIPARAPTSNSHPHTIPRDSSAPIAAVGSSAPQKMDEETVQVSMAEAKAPFAAIDEDTIEMSAETAAAVIEAARTGVTVKDMPTPAIEIDPAMIAGQDADDVVTDVEATTPTLARIREKSVPPPAPGSRARTESELRDKAISEVRDGAKSEPPPFPPRAATPSKPAVPKAPPVPSALAKPKLPSPVKPGGETDLGWAAGGIPKPTKGEDSGPSGPTGGLAKSIPVADAAFASSRIALDKVKPDEFKDGRFVPTDHSRPSDSYVAADGGGAGKWIVLVALLIFAGAAAAMYFVVFKDSGNQRTASSGIDAGESASDASTTAVIPSTEEDAGSTGDSNEFIGALETAFDRFDRSGVEQLKAELESLPKGFEREVNRARLHNALAQHELDDGQLVPKDARKRSTASRKQANTALGFANAALALEKASPLANAAKADALRLNGSPSREVERWLRNAKDSSEAKYVSAMLRIRDKRDRDAQTLLNGLQSTNPTPRVLYRLAMVAMADGKYNEANTYMQTILALDSEHEGATKLAALLEEKLSAGDGDGDGDSPTPPTKPDESRPADYDGLLSRADKAAETGNCAAAVKMYEKALDANPSGVAALTGLGYCHLDFKQYSSAQARFRAALGISPRYQDALWGVAEGYQQQGLKEQAIKAFRSFISEHPASRRADMAKRQIERLGGSVDEPPEAPEPEAPKPEAPEPEASKPEASKPEPSVAPAPAPEPTPES